jgi:hypothetical protein
VLSPGRRREMHFDLLASNEPSSKTESLFDDIQAYRRALANSFKRVCLVALFGFSCARV